MQMYAKNSAFGGNPASFVMKMGGGWVEKPGQGKFVKYAARAARKSTVKEIEQAIYWSKMVVAGKAKSEEAKEEEGVPF